MSTPTKQPRTLVDFAKDKKRSDCPVCRIPQPIRDQMRVASDKKIKRAWVIEWLKSDYSTTINEAELNAHVNGRHDD